MNKRSNSDKSFSFAKGGVTKYKKNKDLKNKVDNINNKDIQYDKRVELLEKMYEEFSNKI
jgi:hypothetical protein